MMELNELRHIWRESVCDPISGYGKEEITMLLQRRSADLKKQILKRVTSEIKTYLLTGLFILCVLVAERLSTGRTFLLGASALLVMAPAIGALAYKEYRLRTLPMSRSLRGAISRLRSRTKET